MIHKPIVSVILPAYNAEKYLSAALESILAQSFTDFECIVIDDCSTDSTWSIAQQYADRDARVKVLKNEKNLKLSGTLNRGIHLATGKYIARMDADDWSYPERLAIQVRYLNDHPDTGICGGSMEVCNEKLNVQGRRAYNLTDQVIRKKIFFYSPFSHPLVMMRKSVLDMVGYYREEYNPAEDYELYFRIGEKSLFANVPDTLLKYRVVPHSMTTGSTKKMELVTIRIRKEYAAIYGMSFFGKIYNFLQYCSLFFIPSKTRIRIFQAIRNR